MVPTPSAATLLSAVCVAVFSLPPASALAERGETGRIVGYVFDQGGVPLAGVKLTATPMAGAGAPRSTYSSPEGTYILDGLPAGPYAVRAIGPSLKEVVLRGVVVSANGDVETNVIMEGRDADPVMICGGGRPAVYVRSAARPTEVDAAFLSALPLPLALFPEEMSRYMLSMEPHAMASARGHGPSAVDNGLSVDGFSLGDPVSGRSWLRLPASMLAAMDSRAYGFGADAPDAAGGTLMLITRSGSNKPEILAQGGLELGRDERTTRAGIGLFGPVVRDRAWYSFAADVIQARRGSNQPDTEMRALQAAAKVTWLINARNKLNVTAIVNGDGLDDDKTAAAIPGVRPGLAPFDARGSGGFAGLSTESLVTDSFVTHFQIAAGQSHETLEPANAPSVPVSPETWALHRTSRTRSLELRARLEWYPGSSGSAEHEVRLELRGRLANHQTASHTGWALGAFPDSDPDRAHRLVEDPETARSGRLFLDLSDRLRLTRHVTVTGGLGWVGARAGTGRGGTAYTGWAMTPHLGLAWDVTRDGRSVVRANIERHVDTGSLSLAHPPFPGAALESCGRDATTGAFTSECDRVRDPRAVVDSKTAFPRGTEVAFGVEREITLGTALSVDVLHRRFDDGWHPHVGPPVEPAVPVTGHPPARDVPARRYIGVTTTITRREGRLKLLGGYTVGRDTDPGAATADATAHMLRLHAAATVAANLTLGGLYHFSGGGAAEGRGFLGRPAPAHEAGVRLQCALRLADDYRLTLFADGVAAVGGRRRRTAEQFGTREPLPLPPAPFRAAFGLEATY